MKPLIIAHRGDGINHKENTISAFESAFNYGADGIELDTQLDDKGKIIVVHDFGFDENQTYPLLDDVINKFSKMGVIEIEIKSPFEESLKKVTDIVKNSNLNSYELTSSIMPHLPKVRNLIPEAKIGLIFNKDLIQSWMSKEYINLMIYSYIEMVKANVLHLPIDYYNEENVKFFKSKGIILHAHLGFDIKKFQKVIDLEIDQCTIDDVTKINYLKGLQDYFGQAD